MASQNFNIKYEKQQNFWQNSQTCIDGCTFNFKIKMNLNMNNNNNNVYLSVIMNYLRLSFCLFEARHWFEARACEGFKPSGGSLQ